MPARYYDSRLLRPWWETLTARPDDRMALGAFADFLAERDHEIAVAMRWAFEQNKRPWRHDNINGTLATWYWFNGESKEMSKRSYWANVGRESLLPGWLMRGSGNYSWRAFYHSCESAWQNFCRRFVQREKKLRLNEGMFVA